MGRGSPQRAFPPGKGYILIRKRQRSPWLERLREEDAQGMVEYGLLLGLMVVVCLAAMTSLGENFTAFFTSVANTIASTLASIS